MNIQKFTTFKTILIALVLTINANQLFAQTTNGIFFQAVARDNFSNPAKDRKIYVQSSIIQTTPTGIKVLTEEHQANTDATGVFSISLGNGVRVGGTATSLATIDWSKGPFYLNLKVAITPIGGNSNWNYSKEWVDMGTTSFGAVPFALYSASSAKVDDKLNVSDTTTMLKVYAKAMSVKTLETSLASKLTAADTLTMLAPYAKAAYTIDSSFFKSQLATKLSLSDSAKYVTPTQLAAKTFDQTPITNAIATKLNITDTIYYSKQKFTDSAFAKKLNIADSAIYVTKTQLASFNFSSGGGSSIDTSSLSSRINLKANASDITTLNTSISSNTASITSNVTAINVEATRARAAELVLTNNVAANTASITANTSSIEIFNTNVASNTSSNTANAKAIATEAARATAAELALTNTLSSNTANISSNTTSINTNTADIITNRANITTNTSGIATNTNAITANTTAIAAEAATARAAELVLTNNISLITTNATSNTRAIDANTASILTNNSDITLRATIISPTFTGTPTAPTAAAGISTTQLATTEFVNNATSNINASSISGTVAVSKGGTGATTLTGLIKGTGTSAFTAATAGTDYQAPISLTTTGTGSATLSGTTLNIPLVSSTANTTAIAAEAATARAAELVLTNNISLITTNATSNTRAIDANTASILTNNSDITLRATIISPTFTGTPTAPTAAAGISTTQLATTEFVNNATSNINASSISGTVAVSKGGTGATTLTGLIKGTGTSAFTAATAGTDYQAPISLTTTGTGSATLSGTTLNIPLVSSTVNTSTLSGTVALANGGTGQTTIAGIQSILGLAGTQVAIGSTAGATTQGAGAIAIGNGSGNLTQGSQSIAIGYVAGQSNQGANSVAIGSNAAQSGQGTQSVAIGYGANSAANYATALGANASAGHTNATALGFQAATTANNTIQLGADGVTISGSTAITNVKTTGTLTAGTVTYPNAHNATAGQLLSINATGTATWATPASSGGTHTIGESYCGGTVFYVWDGGAHGLIGANAAVAINVYWSGNSTANTYANKQGVLGGQFNTERILKTFPVIYVAAPYYGMVNASIGAQPAAYIASSYRPDYIENGVSKKGLGDWYLPDLEEMDIMMKSGLFNYLTTTGTPSTNNGWWTSYERTDYPTYASIYYGNIITNGVGTTNGNWSTKTSWVYNVTAIRAF